jgi:hypothetical protein
VDYSVSNGFAGEHYILNSYILQTGSTWRGPIGKCVLNVDWTGVKTFSRPSLSVREFFERKIVRSPMRWKFDYRRATCTLLNIEPNYNLDLGMIDRFWGFAINGDQIPAWIGISDADDRLRGPRTDIEVPSWMVAKFFGKWKSQEGSPVSSGLLPDFKLIDRKKFRANGNVYKLKRPAKGPMPPASQDQDVIDAEPTYVRLRDVVQALHGTYRYNSNTEVVELRVPRRSGPRPGKH